MIQARKTSRNSLCTSWYHTRMKGTDTHMRYDMLPPSADLGAIFNEIHTKRLVLRRPRPTDEVAMFAIHGDPATNRYNPHGPDPDLATSEESLRSWLQRWEEYGFGYWSATFPQSENIVGFGGAEHRVPGWSDAPTWIQNTSFSRSAGRISVLPGDL